MIIAQITDLHLRTDGRRLKGLVDSEARLDAAITHLNALSPRPDLVLATGDLANKAHTQDYVALRRAFDRLEMPSYVIPGNHDDRAMLRDIFADMGYLPESGPFLHYVIEDYPLRLIGLDTMHPGSDGGEFCAERRAWLDDRLTEQQERPTLIFMHHPPFETRIGYMDKLAFIGAAELEAVVARHPQVLRVIAGHMHRDITVAWGGTIATVASSLVFQMALDLAPGAPSAFVLEPPAANIYYYHPGQGIIQHRSVIGDFGPRHPFVMDPLHPPEADEASE